MSERTSSGLRLWLPQKACFFPNAAQKGSRFTGWGPGAQEVAKHRCCCVGKAFAKSQQAFASVAPRLEAPRVVILATVITLGHLTRSQGWVAILTADVAFGITLGEEATEERSSVETREERSKGAWRAGRRTEE